ncbi:hypothetical protein LZ198_29705 [Myxococcus sp. K15C18031901]|uniref:hypothetical protein n=1 Tax=Myxococcus dinghuensis TaxID=2906761 RepID=UPI0020A826FA|nr:hypothetical protein [Myxococcus dinghuensis]MCP3103063.1 hypothetical protein [Myxococcus dinghuensis]
MQANKWKAMAVVAGVMASASASAQSTGGAFGSAGQFVISSDASGNLGYTTEGAGYGFIRLNPSVDYFLKENLSIGSGVDIAAAFYDGDTVAAFGLNARVGYNIPLGEKVSVWPKGTVTLFLGDNILALQDGTGSAATVLLEGYAPFLYHVTPHFFVGAGPRLSIGLGDDVDVTISVGTTVGGYF